MNEYEVSGIENIARGVCRVGDKVLLCRGRGQASTYLPGGHIEFGEKGREALVREVREELGRNATVGKFLGVVENAFEQHGRPHCEINLVYEMSVDGEWSEEPKSQEDWIGFEWCDVKSLDKANLLPLEMRELVAHADR